jgi:eukaryotic-like serine/threonine-protein kinase
MSSSYPSNSWLGRFIGDNQRYRLDSRLGGGGMGDVFLATDTRVGQQVAVKLLKDALAESPEMRTRFEHEIAICAALQNEHIVHIMDAGVTPEGFPFYVMEYLRGITLGELLRSEHRLGVERTVKIIRQICNGLLVAHQGVNLPDGEHIEAVIHRDLKPDNIFIQPSDLGELVKIVDFGIAKIRYKGRENQTLTHTFLGTLRYASPEQMKGDRDIDARSDIYSLGVILYEMLSGADPFGFNVQARRMSEASWVIAHTSEPPIPLRSLPGCEGFPAELEAAIGCCLEKNPDRRFNSVLEFSLALQAALASLTSSSNETIEGKTIAQVRPQTTPEIEETISRPVQSNELLQTPITLEETISQPLRPPIVTGDDETSPEAIAAPPIALDEEAIPRPLTPIQIVNPSIREETISQPLPPPLNRTELGKTQVQPRPPINPQPPQQREITPNPSKTPWVKLGVGSLLGVGLVGGIYLMYAQSQRPQVTQKIDDSSPTIAAAPIDSTTPDSTATLAKAIGLVNEGKLPAAIDLAKQIPATSKDYAQAQLLSDDATQLSVAIQLCDGDKVEEAIVLGKKILPKSPVYDQAKIFLKKCGAI